MPRDESVPSDIERELDEIRTMPMRFARCRKSAASRYRRRALRIGSARAGRRTAVALARRSEPFADLAPLITLAEPDVSAGEEEAQGARLDLDTGEFRMSPNVLSGSSGAGRLATPIARARARTVTEVTIWANEHGVETTAAPEQIWQLWADVAGWPEWNGDIERIELIGPFAAGSKIVMTPIGDEPIELRIADAVEPDLFVDEADMREMVVRTTHRVRRNDSDRGASHLPYGDHRFRRRYPGPSNRSRDQR
jgi:hypothetical protein